MDKIGIEEYVENKEGHPKVLETADIPAKRKKIP